MQRYVLRRLVAIPLLLLGVATVAFFLSHFTKADPLASLVSERQMNNPEVVEAARASAGASTRACRSNTSSTSATSSHGDLGISFRTKRPVLDDIAERLPATLELVVAAMLFGTLTGIAARRAGGALPQRRASTTARGSSRCSARRIPVFWSGLILLFIFSVKLGWLPGPGRLDARTAAPPFVTGMYHDRCAARRRPARFRRALSPPAAPRLRARLDGDGHHLAAGAGEHARRAEPGLHPRRARQGRRRSGASSSTTRCATR